MRQHIPPLSEPRFAIVAVPALSSADIRRVSLSASRTRHLRFCHSVLKTYTQHHKNWRSAESVILFFCSLLTFCDFRRISPVLSVKFRLEAMPRLQQSQ